MYIFMGYSWLHYLGLLQDQLKLELANIQKLLDDLAQENTDIRDQLKTLEQVTDSGSA